MIIIKTIIIIMTISDNFLNGLREEKRIEKDKVEARLCKDQREIF